MPASQGRGSAVNSEDFPVEGEPWGGPAPTVVHPCSAVFLIITASVIVGQAIAYPIN